MSVVDDNTIHKVFLNFFCNKQVGQEILTKLQHLRNEADELKKNVLANLIRNVNNQSQDFTIFEYASAFDLHRKIDLNKRLKYIDQLFDIYCIMSMLLRMLIFGLITQLPYSIQRRLIADENRI